MLPFKGKSLLNKATSNKREPVPGFTLHEISKLTLSEPPALCEKINKYIFKRLANKDPIVKAKVLRVIKHVAQKGSKDFRMSMKQNIAPIKELQMYTCPRDQLEGKRPQENVRKFAKEALAAIYSSGESVASSRMQSFSHNSPGRSHGSGKSTGRTGGSPRSKYEGFGSNGTGSSGNSYSSGSQKYGRAIQGTVTSGGGRAGWKKRGGASSSLGSGNSGSGGGGSRNNTNNGTHVSFGKPSNEAATDGTYERNLVDGLVGGGGVRSSPDKARMDEFCKRCRNLKANVVGKILRKRLEESLDEGSSNTVKKALAVISALVKADGCSEFLAYFKKHSEEVEDCLGEGGSIKKKAKKLMAVLEPDDGSDDDEDVEDGGGDDGGADDLLGGFGDEGGGSDGGDGNGGGDGAQDLFSGMGMGEGDGGTGDLFAGMDALGGDGDGDMFAGMDAGAGGGDGDGDMFGGMDAGAGDEGAGAGGDDFMGMGGADVMGGGGDMGMGMSTHGGASNSIIDAFGDMTLGVGGDGTGTFPTNRDRRLSKEGVSLLDAGLSGGMGRSSGGDSGNVVAGGMNVMGGMNMGGMSSMNSVGSLGGMGGGMNMMNSGTSMNSGMNMNTGMNMGGMNMNTNTGMGMNNGMNMPMGGMNMNMGGIGMNNGMNMNNGMHNMGGMNMGGMGAMNMNANMGRNNNGGFQMTSQQMQRQRQQMQQMGGNVRMPPAPPNGAHDPIGDAFATSPTAFSSGNGGIRGGRVGGSSLNERQPQQKQQQKPDQFAFVADGLFG